MSSEPRQDEYGLNPKQRAFLDLHFSGQCISDAKAYELAGYSPKGAHTSASKLLKLPKSQKYLAILRREAHQNLLNQFGNIASEMLEVLREIALEKSNPPQTRVSAAKGAIDAYATNYKHGIQDEAIAEMEERINELGKRP